MSNKNFSGTSFFPAISQRPVLAGATTASIVAGLTFSLFAVSPALATDSCGGVTGATEVEPGICELQFTTAGTTTFTPPAGLTNLDALVVGAGGGGSAVNSTGDPVTNAMSAYGGGGGGVSVVSLDTTNDVTITVGAGGIAPATSGSASSVAQNGNTTIEDGGESGAWGSSADSGSGNPGDSESQSAPNGGGYPGMYGGGGGADGNGDFAQGGAGVVVNTLIGASTTLFANDTTCYGGGGGTSMLDYRWLDAHWSIPQCGGGAVTLTFTDDMNPDPTTATGWEMTSPVANSGGGGAGYVIRTNSSGSNVSSTDGADGTVILRFDGTAPTPAPLPNTGANLGANATGIGVVAASSMAAGAVAFAIATIRRRISKGLNQ